jgi:hypothetical protein
MEYENLDNIVARVVNEGTAKQQLVFSFWFLFGSKKADAIIELMNTGLGFVESFNKIKNVKK